MWVFGAAHLCAVVASNCLKKRIAAKLELSSYNLRSDDVFEVFDDLVRSDQVERCFLAAWFAALLLKTLMCILQVSIFLKLVSIFHKVLLLYWMKFLTLLNFQHRMYFSYIFSLLIQVRLKKECCLLHIGQYCLQLNYMFNYLTVYKINKTNRSR